MACHNLHRAHTVWAAIAQQTTLYAAPIDKSRLSTIEVEADTDVDLDRLGIISASTPKLYI